MKTKDTKKQVDLKKFKQTEKVKGGVFHRGAIGGIWYLGDCDLGIPINC